jgi:uncharacterized membrane protein
MTERPLIATHTRLAEAHQPNLGFPERALSILSGTALLLNGLRRGGVSGVLQACLGSYALVRGASGKCALKKAVSHTPFEEAFQEQEGWKHSEAVSRSITIGKPLDEVLVFIKEPQNVGQLVSWVDSVEDNGGDTSTWTASALLGRKLTWTVTLLDSGADFLHWRAEPDSIWEHDISVNLTEAAANRGTQVKVVVTGKPPLGKLGYAAAMAAGQFTDKALLNLLHSIKQKLETGEVSTNHMRSTVTNDFFYVHPASAPHGGSDPASLKPVKTGVVIEGGNV